MLAFVLSCVFLFICSMHLVLLGFAFTIRFQRFLLWISNSTTHFLKWKIYMMQNIFTRTKCGNEKTERLAEIAIEIWMRSQFSKIIAVVRSCQKYLILISQSESLIYDWNIYRRIERIEKQIFRGSGKLTDAYKCAPDNSSNFIKIGGDYNIKTIFFMLSINYQKNLS